MTAHLAVSGITKTYGPTVAVDGISFDVDRGEFFTLLGPSGCGKTTTLGLIAGFIEPDAGTVVVDGRDITSAPPEDRNIGVVFQSYALFPHLTVLENVMFPLEMRKVSHAEAVERARSALDLVQFPMASAYPSEISGGQAQRVALARSLVFEPELLLMDEPLAALDRKLRQAMQFELREIQERTGTTVVYVTHDQEEALVLSDQIALMRDGRFEQRGSPESIYNEPANAFVAGFIGESNRVSVVPRGEGYVAADHPDVRFLRVEASHRSGTLLVRPEHVMVTEDPSEVPEDDFRHEATVEDLVFLGDHVRVKLLLGKVLPWVAKLNAFDSRLPALRRAMQERRVVQVFWPRQRVRVLDQDATAVPPDASQVVSPSVLEAR